MVLEAAALFHVASYDLRIFFCRGWQVKGLNTWGENPLPELDVSSTGRSVDQIN